MADEKFKISGLNAALDEYLSKIDKVNLSRESLLANQKLLEDCIRLSDSLDSKIKAIESSGASVGEKSARAGLLSRIKTTALSGGSVDSLLRQEARAVDLTRRGTAASSFPSLSLSERDGLQSLSAGINKSGLGPTFSQVSPAQLRPLLDWSSRSGSAPSRRSMMSYMQESTFSLGSGLDSRIGGDSDHLVTELAAEDRQEKFEEAVATIESTSDAILAAIGKHRGGTNITVEASKPKKPKKDHGSWWSTLKLLGGIAGTAGALYGILSIPKVQDWIKNNIIDPDGRNDLFSKITAIWDKVTSVYDLIASSTTSPKEHLLGQAQAGVAAYTTASDTMRSRISDFADTLSNGKPFDAYGISGNESLVTSGSSAAFDTLAGGLLAGGAVGAGIRWGGLSALYKLAGPLVTTMGFTLLGLRAWREMDKASRTVFNMKSMAYALKIGSGVAYLFHDGSTEGPPALVALSSLRGQSGGTLYSEMSEDDQLGVATNTYAWLGHHLQSQNSYNIINAAFAANPDTVGVLAMGGGAYASAKNKSEAFTDWLNSTTPEEREAFLQAHPELYRTLLNGSLKYFPGGYSSALNRSSVLGNVHFESLSDMLHAASLGYPGGENDPEFQRRLQELRVAPGEIVASGGYMKGADWTTQRFHDYTKANLDAELERRPILGYISNPAIKRLGSIVSGWTGDYFIGENAIEKATVGTYRPEYSAGFSEVRSGVTDFMREGSGRNPLSGNLLSLDQELKGLLNAVETVNAKVDILTKGQQSLGDKLSNAGGSAVVSNSSVNVQVAPKSAGNM